VLKHNTCKKNNPLPPPLFFQRGFALNVIQKAGANFTPRERVGALMHSCIRRLGSCAILEPGQLKVEVSLMQLWGKHQLCTEQRLRKPLSNSPPPGVTSGWRLARRCASCLPLFGLTRRFLSFSLHKFPPPSARSPGLSLRTPRGSKG